jgi:hypothetical protein
MNIKMIFQLDIETERKRSNEEHTNRETMTQAKKEIEKQ